MTLDIIRIAIKISIHALCIFHKVTIFGLLNIFFDYNRILVVFFQSIQNIMLQIAKIIFTLIRIILKLPSYIPLINHSLKIISLCILIKRLVLNNGPSLIRLTMLLPFNNHTAIILIF